MTWPTMTQHAMERWVQRCAHMDPNHEWSRARSVTAKRLAKLNHHSRRQHRHEAGTTYRVSPGGVVFVVRGDVIVTVYTLEYRRARQALLDGPCRG